MFYEHCRINHQLYRDIVTLNWFLIAKAAKAAASKGKECETGAKQRKQHFQALLRFAQCLILYFGNINWPVVVALLVVVVLCCSIKSLPQKWWPRQRRSPEVDSEVEVEAEDKGMQRNVRPNSTMCGVPLCHMTHWARVSSLHLIDGARNMWPEFRYRYNSNSNGNRFRYF